LNKESYWYRKIFESHYPDKGDIIPHYWLPNWSDQTDPSARELS
jgi:asparagine synthase (glutamine-hydrolysing)